MEEKRKFFRYCVAIDAKCGLMARLEPLICCYTDNISGGGICLPVSKKINEGSMLDLEITLPDDFVPIFAIGEVSWLKKDNSEKDTFKAGIEFKAIDDYDRNRIANFISNKKTSS